MKARNIIMCAALATGILATDAKSVKAPEKDNFDYTVDNFADVEVLRYKVPGFENLSLNQKKYIYYLTEAALWGRDILWDQHYKYNLPIRDLLETIYVNYNGDKNSKDYKAFEEYFKRVEFANGIHHHYATDKVTPAFSREFLEAETAKLGKGSWTPVQTEIFEAIFNPEVAKKQVNQTSGQDLVLTSANNLYEGVTQKEVEDYYASIKKADDPTPISYGLNAKVVKKNGKVTEEVYKLGGLYSTAIAKIIKNLEKASQYAENDTQRAIIAKLVDYYKTGDLKKFDEYSILWADDKNSKIDFINGFIEDYGDPLGMTGAWESIVNFRNDEASHRTEVLSGNAQWFEDHSPVDKRFKKDKVKGVSAKVITAAILAGDAYPATPIGINLPNSNWIRAAHGSKSVTIENITEAYEEAAKGNGFNEEFVIDKPTADIMDKWLFITDNLHTDLHECLGHGSGKLLPGVSSSSLKEHGSTIEETRADLFALYYLADPKLIELGLLSDPDAYKSEYYKYLLNGLMTQLMRIEPGKDVEEAHMRNRKLISEWALKHGAKDNVVELVKQNGKTFVKINDYKALRDLFGQLLAEIQRITSEGDYQAACKLVEDYAVKVDPELHREVLDRYSHLTISPYKGFVNPVYKPVTDKKGNITDIVIDYTEDYIPQMLRYSRDYAGLKK